jgi:hypothetical protein
VERSKDEDVRNGSKDGDVRNEEQKGGMGELEIPPSKETCR